MGAAIGSVFMLLGGMLFCILLLVTMGMAQVFARTAGWALLGLGIGLCSGLTARSMSRVKQGCWGGAIGGLLSGLVFDLLAHLSGNTDASLPRLVGFTTLGAFAGFATAVVEQLGKVAWLTILTGAREGRQVLLNREVTVLGRDEMADVPLFHDHRVERRHAELTLEPTPVIREVGLARLMQVDGHPVQEAVLYDGAVVQIGKNRLRFHHKYATATRHAAEVYSGVPVQSVPAPAAPPVPMQDAPPVWTTSRPGYRDPRVILYPDLSTPESRELSLRVVNGSGAGSVARLTGDGITLGRETTNTIPVEDPKVSRYHARIERLGEDWILTDLGSTNGTRINGVQVSRAGLAAGDYVYLGDTVLVVEGGVPAAADPAGSSTVLE
jgi:pSer/pThr/pTyr-binding forkhead associated (FHA) protein